MKLLATVGNGMTNKKLEVPLTSDRLEDLNSLVDRVQEAAKGYRLADGEKIGVVLSADKRLVKLGELTVRNSYWATAESLGSVYDRLKEVTGE